MRKLFAKSSLPPGTPLPSSSGGSGTGLSAGAPLAGIGGGATAAAGGGASLVGNYSSFIGKQFSVCHHEVTVENVIAEGGFSIVFLVTSSSGQKLAMKRMFVNNDEDLHACRRELKISSTLSDHPHIIDYIGSSVHSCGDSVHEILLLMPYYRNSLLNLMNERLQGGFTETEVLDIFCDVCEAVSRLHHCQTPIIHRDLKVENVLISDDGTRVLCDFGSATSKELDPAVLPVSVVNEEIKRYTTPSYRAPEMVDLYSGYTLTTKTDIWALGCFLYKLCYFTLPFGDSALAIQSGQLNFPDSPVYSVQLQTIIRYTLQVDPTIRPDIFQVTSLVSSMAGRPCNTQNLHNSVVPDLATLTTHLATPSHCGTGVKPSFMTAPATTTTSTTNNNNNSSVGGSRCVSSTIDNRDVVLAPEVSTSVAPRQRPKSSKTALCPRMSASHTPAMIAAPSVSPAAVELNGFTDNFAPPSSAASTVIDNNTANNNNNNNNCQHTSTTVTNNSNSVMASSSERGWVASQPICSTSKSKASVGGCGSGSAPDTDHCFADDFSRAVPVSADSHHGGSSGSGNVGLTSPLALHSAPISCLRLQPPAPFARPTHRRNHSDNTISHRLHLVNAANTEPVYLRGTDQTAGRIPASLQHRSDASCTTDGVAEFNMSANTAACWNPFESDFCPVVVPPPGANQRKQSQPRSLPRSSITDTHPTLTPASAGFRAEAFTTDHNSAVDDDPFGAAPFTMPACMRKNVMENECNSDPFRRESSPLAKDPVYTFGPIENRARYTKLTSDLSPAEHLQLIQQQEKERDLHHSDQSLTGSVDSIGSATDLRSSYDSGSENGSDIDKPSSINQHRAPSRGRNRRRHRHGRSAAIDTQTVTGTVASSLYQAECESVADEAQAEGRVRGPGGASLGMSTGCVLPASEVVPGANTTVSAKSAVKDVVGGRSSDLLIGHQYGDTPLLDDDELSLCDYATSHTLPHEFDSMSFTHTNSVQRESRGEEMMVVSKTTPSKLGWRRPRFRHHHHQQQQQKQLLTTSHENLDHQQLLAVNDTEPLCPLPANLLSRDVDAESSGVVVPRKAFTLPRLYATNTATASRTYTPSQWLPAPLLSPPLRLDTQHAKHPADVNV